MTEQTMSFPIYPEKHTLKELYGAKEIVGYRKQVGRMPSLAAPQGVLFCLERGLPWRLRWRIPVTRAGGMNGDLYALKNPKDKIGIMTGFGGGSPMTVELAEEFAAMGVKCMILMTWGGLLQTDLKPGDIIVIDRAIRDEGTSYHYLPPAKYIDANSELADQLMEALQAQGVTCSRGTTWTTDAPFRETVEEIRQYQSEGVKTVEMESAGLFTVGQVRNIPTASVVIGMDQLSEFRWQVPDQLKKIMRSLELVYEASLHALKNR
jgi:uridine phosphorylase